MKLGILILRGAIGSVFVAHGLQKLTGAFEGPGLEGTEKMVASMDMRPARLNARAVALAETLGGAGLLLGAATPLAATAVTAAMTTAVRKVHAANGFFNSKRGYEFNAVLVAGAIAIVADGPGKVSVDAVTGRSKWGALWAIGALGAGIAASSAAIVLGARASEAERDASAGTADAEDDAVGAEGAAD